MRTAAVCVALLSLTACGGSGDDDPGPGGVTVGEARALDEAAEMIEARNMPQDAASAAAPTPAPTEAAPRP